MSARGFTLRLGSDTYTFGMPNTLATRITGGDEDRLNAPIDVLVLSIVEDGFLFVTANDEGKPAHEVKYAPQCFPEFKEHMRTLSTGVWPAVLKLETTGAKAILKLFYQWMNDQFAELAMARIEDGALTFEDVREARREVFKVPAFQRFVAEKYAADDMPKRGIGKRRKHNQAVEDLYALACRVYRETPGLSFEAACYMATEYRPDLVPPTWKADPDGNLKRDAARYWDGSCYSQLSYRMVRDR